MSYRYLASWRDYRRFDSQAGRTEREGSRRSRSMPVYTYTTIDGPLVTTGLVGGINDNGQIVGSYTNNSGGHGFLLSGGTYTTLDDPLGVGSTSAQGIN